MQKENVRQQALEQATREEVFRLETAKGEKFKREQEDQYALHKLDAMLRIAGTGRTGLSVFKYADKSPNVVVRGRGAVKYVPDQQPPTSYAAQEAPAKVFPGQVPSSARVWENELSVKAETSNSSFPQRTDYSARGVGGQQDIKVKVENSPVKVEAPQVKREVEVPQTTQTEAPPIQPVLNASNWQQYLANQNRR